MLSLADALKKLREQKIKVEEQTQPDDNFKYFQQAMQQSLQQRLIAIDLLCKLLAQEIFSPAILDQITQAVVDIGDDSALQLQQIKCLLTLVITYKYCTPVILQCLVNIYLYSTTQQQHSKAALLQIVNSNPSQDTLKFLCKLSSKVDKQQQQQISELALKARQLGLELLLSVLSGSSQCTETDTIKQQVTLCISKNSLLQSNSFDTCLGIFLVLVSNYRTVLKAEFEILFNEIYLYLLEHPQTTYKNKCTLLDGMNKISAYPQILLDVWVNYDCEVGMVCVFERLCYIVSKCAKGNQVMIKETGVFGILDGTFLNEPTVQNERKFRVKALRCLLSVALSLSQWLDSAVQNEQLKQARMKVNQLQVEESVSPTINQKILLVSKNPIEDVHMSSGQQSETVDSADVLVNKKKQLIKDSTQKFIEGPNKAVQLLIDNQILTDHESVAQYLHSNKQLNKKAIGEYLGDFKQFNIQVMHSYIDLFDFNGVDFVKALRLFMQAFRLPGEAQKIDRILEKFSARYCVCNPGVFAKADVAYTLSFSIMMLNTDQHSVSIKNRMTVQDFIKNNRGINDNADLGDDFLTKIFEEIRDNEIVMEEERSVINKMTAVVNKKRSKEEFKIAEKKSVGLLKQGANRTVPPFKSATNVDHVKPMFEQFYKGSCSNFLQVFEDCLVGSLPQQVLSLDQEVPQNDTNAEVTKICLLGMVQLVKISCLLEVDGERQTIITAFARMTNSEKVDSIKYKNFAAALFLLQMVDKYGNLLEESWKTVLQCISRLAPLVEGNAPVKDLLQRRPSFKHVYEAYQSQSMTIAIDKIFANSVRLDGSNILHFYEALCKISEDEVELGVTFMLQKIVEISYYNMSRIRLEWTLIWKVLTVYFNKVGCHSDTKIASYAIDSLRQLGMKFLARVEPSQFQSNHEFLKPFEYIIKSTPHVEIKEQVLQAMQQMISQRSQELKSGWRSIFIIISRAANDDMSSRAFDMLQQIVKEHPKILDEYLVDYAGCVVEFALLPSNADIHESAIQLLVKSIEFLKSRTSGVLLDEDFHLNWFPILSGLSRIISVSQEASLRNKCIDTLFALLTEHVDVFKLQYWMSIMKSVILPIFEDVSSDSLASSAVWISCLRKLLTFYQDHFELFSQSEELLDVPYNLMVALVSTNSDNLASTGIICFQQYVSSTYQQYNDNGWQSCTKCIQLIYDKSIPTELLKFPTIQSKQLTDVEAENEASVVASIDVPHAILKCAIQLMVLQMTRDLLLPHDSNSLPSQFMQSIPSELRYRWIQQLHKSYEFAHQFNANYDLRLALKKSGVVQKMPDLIKQETQAMSSYLSVLYHVYRFVGENESEMVKDSCMVLELYASFVSDPVKFQRDINNWSPVVASIWKELASIEFEKFKPHIKKFYREALKLVVFDGRPEVRQQVLSFLTRIEDLL